MLKKANVVVLLLVQIFFLTNINFAFAYRNQDVLAASSVFKQSLNIEDLIKTSKIRYAQDHGIIKTVKSMDEYKKLQNQGYSLTPNGYLERGIKGGDESFKGEKLLSFQAHKGEVTHIKILTPELLLTAGTDKKLKIWNLKQGICQKEIEYGESLITNMLKLKDNTIVTTHQNGEIKFWDILNGEVSLSKNISPDTEITSLAELTKGELAIGLENGQIKIINRFLVQKKVIESHKASVNALVGMVDGRLASAGEDGKIKIWKKDYSFEKEYTQGHSFAVQGLIEIKNGDRKLLSLGKDGTIQLWRTKKDEINKGVVKTEFKIEQALTLIELLDKNPATVAIGTCFGEIKIYDRRKGRLLYNYNEDTGKINVLETISQGITASGTNQGIITIWDFGYSNKKRYRSKNVDMVKSIKVELKQEEKKEIKIQSVQTQQLEKPEIITKEEQIQEEVKEEVVQKKAKEEKIQEEKQIEPPVIPKIEIIEEEKRDLSQKVEKLKQKRVDKYKEQESYNENLYISLQASNIPYSESNFDLEEKIKEFIENKDLKELILFAQGGSGKTLFSKRLEHDLWNKFKSQKDIIPLYISLPSLENYKERAIEETLEKYGFTEKEIEILKQNNKFLFILDGYDELLDYPNLYEENELGEWNAKTIITCRQEYFIKFAKGHQGYLYPLKENGIPEYNKTQELYITPFSESQRQTYIEKYIQQSQTNWQVKDYEYHITSNPALEELAKTPFTLKLIVEVLPTLIEKQNKDKDFKIGINAIYDAFIGNWFSREVEKLETKQDINLTEEQKQGKHAIFRNYCERLASAMHKKGLTEVEYKKTKNQQNEWMEFFDSSDDEIKWCQRACPIIKSEQGNKWRFLHKSLQEYFVTRQTLNIVERDLAQKQKEKKQEQSEKAFKRIIEGMNSQLEEPSIIRFRVDSIKENSEYKDIFFKIIELSKTDAAVSVAAANAITALNGARFRFSGVDLSGIRVPGADLTGAVMDSTNLEGSDLTNVKMRGAFLRNANLTKSIMQGVWFGEMPALEGHSYVVYSPDGKTLATVGKEHTIILYNAETGEEIRKIEGHAGNVTGISYSPDGKTLASCSQDNTIRVWNVETGEELRKIEGHTGWVNGIIYSPDGKTLASCSQDNTIRLWNVETGGEIRKIEGHTGWVNGITYSPDGKMLASCSRDDTIRLCNLETGEMTVILEGHSHNVLGIAYSPDGNIIAVASEDNTVKLWDLKTRKIVIVLKGHGDDVNSVKYSPDGKTIATVSRDNTVKLWDAETGKEITSFRGHTDSVSCVAFAPDGKMIASASEYNTVKLWDVKIKKDIGAHRGHSNCVYCVVYSPDGKTIATASGDKTVKIWDSESGEEKYKLIGHNGSVYYVAYSPDGKTIATASGDSTVKLWDVETGKEISTLKGHRLSVYSVSFSPDGKTIATASMDKTVMLWDVETGKETFVLEGHTEVVSSVSFSPYGKTIASGSWDNTVKLWDPESGEIKNTLIGHEGYVYSVIYSPDGKTIATASGDNTVKLWDLESGEEQKTLRGHNGSVHSVAFSPDGKTIATASGDNTVKLWDKETGEEIITLKGHVFDVNSVVFSPNGKRLATVSDDKTLNVWDLSHLENHSDVKVIWIGASIISLFCGGCKIEDISGLSTHNYDLFKQRFAIDDISDPYESIYSYEEKLPDFAFSGVLSIVDALKDAFSTVAQKEKQLNLQRDLIKEKTLAKWEAEESGSDDEIDLDDNNFGLDNIISQLDHEQQQNDIRINTDLGNINFNKKEYQTALKHYETALNLDPLSPETNMQVGMVYHIGLKNYELAKVYYGKAIDLGQNVTAYQNLGCIHVEENDLDKAEEFFKKSADIGPSTGTYCEFSFFLQYRRKKYEEALEYATKAIKINDYQKHLFYTKKELDSFDDGIKQLCEDKEDITINSVALSHYIKINALIGLRESSETIKMAFSQFKEYVDKHSEKSEYEMMKQLLEYSQMLITGFTDWEIPKDKIENESKYAKTILEMCAYIGDGNIPEIIIKNYIKESGVKDDEIENIFEDAIEVLEKYKMIKLVDKGTYRIYMQVQESMRVQILVHEKKEIIERVLTVFQNSIAFDVHKLETMNKNKGLISHAVVLLKHAEEAGVKLEDLPKLYNVIGEFERKWNENCDNAIKYYDKALSIILTYFRENQEFVTLLVSIYNNIGESYRFKGEHGRAIEYNEKALQMQLEVGGENHIDTAQSYNNLGNAYNIKGEYDKAIEYYNKSMKIRSVCLGVESLEVAKSCNNLGATFSSKREYDKAIEYHNKALKIRLSQLGENDLVVGSSYNNLGITYNSKGEYSKAKECYENVLLIYEKILGKNHSKTIRMRKMVEDISLKYKEKIEGQGLRGAKGEPSDAANLTPFPSQAQIKEDLNFTVPENIPQEITITVDPAQTSIACNKWDNQTQKGEINISQSFIKFIQTNLNKTQYDDAVSVILNTELTQINQQKLNGRKYSIEIDEEEFKDFEVNTLLHSWINNSKDKLLNYKTALESYWQYLIEQNYKDKETHQQGVESYLAILDYIINNHVSLGGVIDNADVLLTVETIKGSKVEMMDEDQIGNVKRLVAA